jgi:hypothetical protein
MGQKIKSAQILIKMGQPVTLLIEDASIREMSRDVLETNLLVVSKATVSHRAERNISAYILVIASAACSLLVVTSCGSGPAAVTPPPPPPPPPNFTLSATASTLAVPPGGYLTVQLSVIAEYGFSGSVSVDLTGAPAGTKSSPALPLTMTSGSQTLTLFFPADAAQTSYDLSFQGTSGKLQQTATLGFQIAQQTLAGFSLVLNDKELSFAQGGSAFTTVGLSETSDGNADYYIQFSVLGLPPGVQATFASNPMLMNQAASLLTFTASPNAGLANYAVISVTGTRAADGVQESASFLLNITPPTASIPPVRTDFVRLDGTPAAAVYDPVHDVVYVSNPQWNRVDVISPSTHQIVKSIPAPAPTGMDLSLDGKHLIVGSNTQEIVSIDTSLLQVVQRSSVPPLVQVGSVRDIPDLLANLSNGTTLVAMTQFSSTPSYILDQWNPATGSFTWLNPPSNATLQIGNLVRTGDGEKALIVEYGGTNLDVFDAGSNSFSARGQPPSGQVMAVAGNPSAHQFAILGASGLAFVDGNLNTLATPAVGGIFWGMQYSADGTKLYLTMTEAASLCGPYFPVILTYDTSTYLLTGVAPAFETGYPQDCVDTYVQASPLTADSNGLVYSEYNHGLVLDNAANLQPLLNLPEGPPFPDVGFNDEATFNQPLATSLGQQAYDVLPNVYFANTPGTDIQFSGPLVSVTAPPSANAGLVNVTSVEPDSWFALAAQSFSYGSKILFPGGNAGSTQGGAALALVGYGLVGNNGSPTVMIGGQSAAVIAATKYIEFNDGAADYTYPFPDMDEVLVTIPPGRAGAADVVVTSGAGTATLPKAFNYLSVADYSSTDTFTNLLYDPQRHWVYLSAGNHIDVFSADTQQFLPVINPPSLSGARQIRGLALTPDNSKLLAADYGDSSVAIIDPDDPSSSTAVQIPVSQAGASGVADLAATSNGNVFVDAFSTMGSCGNNLFELNLTTLKSTLRTDIGNPGLRAGGNIFSRNTSGNEVLMDGASCASYLWNAATDTFTQTSVSGLSGGASGDGNWYASDYTLLDSQLTQRMQAQIPEFFFNLLVTPDLPGEKMNASGSLLYTPVPGGNFIQESNGVYITDTNTGAFVGGVLLSEQIAAPPDVQTTMDLDEAGNRLFLLTSKGLTVVQLANPPLSIGYVNPATGSAGTNFTIRGSGFESGAAVKVGGAAAVTTFVDSSTLTVAAPAGSTGGARVTVQNPDGTSYSLDDGFVFQ